MLLARDLAAFPAALSGGAIALGNFDGVHLGHQAVIGRARDVANASKLPFGLLTFEPHPRSLFRPDEEPFRLTPMRVKLELFERLGVDVTLCLRFDPALAALSADAFIGEYLTGGMKAKHIVVGEDFCFGAKRSGNASLLADRGRAAGFTVDAVPPQLGPDGVAYSSTRIRQFLKDGLPEQAAILLGRRYRIEGHVQSGDKRGRLLGFPTANLTLDGYLAPRFGVYAVTVDISGTRYGGVANIGLRPTIGTPDLRFETHIFDFSGDLYGQQIGVELVRFIRAERKFDGLDALKAQIAADSAAARALLA
jgi:riboflavin kinase/FMN adenylyltransferase